VDGVSVDEEEKKMGMHGSSTRAVIFQNVKVLWKTCWVNWEGPRGRPEHLNVAGSKLPHGGRFSQIDLCGSREVCKGRVQFGKPISEFG